MANRVSRTLGAGVATGLVLLLSLFVFAPRNVRAATTSTQAVAWLNAQREANGIPGGVVDNPAWDVACQHHMTWLKLNPHVSGLAEHQEIPGTPGYTTDGAWAGAHSVLDGTFVSTTIAAGGTASAFYEPYPWGAVDGWEWAPIHLMDLLDPALTTTGFAPGCMVTGEGPWRTEPATPELLTYPGAGTSWIYPSEQAFEVPYTPGQFVGLPQPSSTTGPYLYVLAWGAGAGSITSASLTGPAGPVKVSTVDDNTTGPLGRPGEYMRPGGFVIPRKPLQPNTAYTASVTFAPDEGVPLSKTWEFRTGPQPNVLNSEPNGSERARGHNERIIFTVTSASPNARLTLTSGTHRTIHAKLRPVARSAPETSGPSVIEYNALVVLRFGAWTACAASGGAGTTFAAAHECEAIEVNRSGAHPA